MITQLFLFLTAPSSTIFLEYGLCFMRITIGILTIAHGYPKIMGGVQTWQFLGGTMANVGIHFWPVFWGLCAACAEFFGGIALTLGLGTRIASLFLIFMMIIAFLMHWNKKDSFQVYSFSLAMIAIFIGFFIAGSGIYSVDAYLNR
ncbi:DoxX family protein [Candidatus Dependentiae bacterium]|nr:DoxX family protein [Candidatus Dependentiae bacterium]